MQRGLLPRMIENKKGLSDLISYVLLIVIAIGMSIGVYSYLKVYVPNEKISCTNDVTLSLQEYVCSENSLNLTLFNSGLFKSDAILIRIKEPNRKISTILDQEKFFPFMPGEFQSVVLTTPSLNGEYELEIQPEQFTEDNKLALCESIIKQKIKC